MIVGDFVDLGSGVALDDLTEGDGTLHGYGINTELRRAYFLSPIAEKPHVGIEVGIAGLKAEVGADEFLEVAALFALGLGGGAVFGEDLLERRGGHGWRWVYQGRKGLARGDGGGMGGQ